MESAHREFGFAEPFDDPLASAPRSKFNAARYHACPFLYQRLVAELADSHALLKSAWVANPSPRKDPRGQVLHCNIP